jgi:hypothetical protein
MSEGPEDIDSKLRPLARAALEATFKLQRDLGPDRL